MQQKIITQIYSVLNKYEKSYTYDGVLKNLEMWQRKKQPLIDLLRKHPNWNENALAVVFEVTQNRDIDEYTVRDYNYDLSVIISELNLDAIDASNFRNALDIAVGSLSKLVPNEQTMERIRIFSGVTCAVGQKTSRVIHKICQRYGLDKHPEYNARFARLADSLNPLQIKRKALLSVHPCDFLEMSNRDNSWSSCHCLEEGEYHAGTLSYMNDSVSMIFYTVDEDVTEDFYTEPRITRQVFCYKDGILLQSRLYPRTDDDETRSIYRDIVQRTISACLDVPNLWALKRDQQQVGHYCTTHRDALHYTDYIYKSYKPNISLLKSVHSGEENQLVIGNRVYCISCSHAICETDSLYCENCNSGDEYTHCEDCGHSILLNSDDDHYIDGYHYCSDCVSWCEHCQSYTRDELISVHHRYGDYSIQVCEDCLNGYYRYCDNCGMYYHIETVNEWDGNFHCRSCLEQYYSTCECCHGYVRCEDRKDMNGKGYCTACVKNIRAEVEEVQLERVMLV